MLGPSGDPLMPVLLSKASANGVELVSGDEPLQTRTYPSLADGHAVGRPISFVTVHFSGDLAHNLAMSECVRDPRNQLVVVENRHNLAHDSLAAALELGISQARHELIACVHEDVLLLPGWQAAAERALAALERHDPQWAFAGAAGWSADGAIHGHYSDPHRYVDNLRDKPFVEVDRIDEQLILFRRRQRVPLDIVLPSIHNIGRDLARAAHACGRRIYAVNAPTVHKFADANGNRIMCRTDSPKILARQTLTYRADRACSDLYYRRKWSLPGDAETAQEGGIEQGRLDSPIVLLAKGGGGSRLLSILAEDSRVFLGRRINASGDSLDLVQATYAIVLAKHRYRDARLLPAFMHALRRGAESLVADGDDGLWGYKLPESLLALDEIVQVFPSARFVHMVRDPLDTCLRRTHMTARYDNQVGQASLLAAYRALGRDPRSIADDSPALHMALTTLHQVGTTLDWTRRLPPDRVLEIRFEDVLGDPGGALQRLRAWLHPTPTNPQGPTTPRILAAVDHKRAANPGTSYPADIRQVVAELLAPLRRRLGYLPAG